MNRHRRILCLWTALVAGIATWAAAQPAVPGTGTIADPMMRAGSSAIAPLADPMARLRGSAATAPPAYDPMQVLRDQPPTNHTDPMARLTVRGKRTSGSLIEGPVLDPVAALPPGEGRELTAAMCNMCHSISLVRQQRLPAAKWDFLWGWMVTQQGMPDLPEPQKTQILAYLKQHFGTDTPR